MSPECVRSGGVTAIWDAEARLLRHTYDAAARPSATDARRMQAWTEPRVGRVSPFGVLVDAGGAGIGAATWRFAWMTWAYHRRHRIRIAVFRMENLSPHVVAGFAAATRTDIRTFSCETEARAWLAAGQPPA